MSEPRVSPPPAQSGVTQQDLVQFGARLVAAGVPTDLIATITVELQEMANEATFKGAARIVELMKTVERDGRDNQALIVDQHLRTLRSSVLSLPVSFGHINRASVVAAINQLITTPEPNPRDARANQQQR